MNTMNKQPFSHNLEDLQSVFNVFSSEEILRKLWRRAAKSQLCIEKLKSTHATYYSNLTPEEYLGMSLEDWFETEKVIRSTHEAFIDELRRDRIEAYARFTDISLEKALGAMGAVNVAHVLRDCLESII